MSILDESDPARLGPLGVPSELESFWRDYYSRAAHDHVGHPVPWLDYSNERVQAQTFGLILEAAGSPYRRRCLDAGCGWGYLARTLHALGGDVTGIDLNPVTVAALRAEAPALRWVCGSILDRELAVAEAPFDLIVLAEVLQYVSLEAALEIWWPRVKPGGRLVGVLPNAGCSIVQRTMARFGGKYLAVSAERLTAALTSLTDRNHWALRGLVFREDQRLWPYDTTPWTAEVPEWSNRANRFLFVVQRPGAT